YFDSADSYGGGACETTIGDALRGKRDRVYLTSKTWTRATDRRDAMMRALEGSLRRLRTDYVDVYFNHAVNDVARLKNPEWHEVHAGAPPAGQDPLRGHVRPRRAAGRVPGSRARHQRRRRDPGRLQLRPGPGLLPEVHGLLRLHRSPAGPAAGARQGQGQG